MPPPAITWSIHVRFGTAPELIKMATSGEPFDLGVVPRDVMKDAAARAQFASAPTPEVARVGIAVAVRAGAPKRRIPSRRYRPAQQARVPHARGTTPQNMRPHWSFAIALSAAI
jgi:hypothetical protein